VNSVSKYSKRDLNMYAPMLEFQKYANRISSKAKPCERNRL